MGLFVSRALGLSVVLMFLFAGCMSPDDDVPEVDPGPLEGAMVSDVAIGMQRMGELRADPLVWERPFTVHVVAVGWDLDELDQAAVRAALPADTSPRIEFGPPLPDGLRGGLLHRIDYAFHEAPDAFAEELFAGYPEISEEVPIPGGDKGFLARYDALYGLGRADSGTMHVVDAQAAEARIEALREAHGLRFEGPHATVFLLDSWSEVGLWRDAYYWYGFHDDLRPDADTANLRAWGGTHDFLFLDRSAAPNDAKTDRSGLTSVYYVLSSQPVYAPEGTAYNDPPVWHYTGDTATVGQGPAEKEITLTEAVIAELDPAVNIRILNDYIFRPIYADRYQINVHLWHDGKSMIPADDLDRLVDAELLATSMQEAVPWAEVDVEVTTYVAPRDDPAMHEAMQRAKVEGANAQLAMPVLLNHVDAHPDKYKRNEPGVFDVMALGFILEGHYAVVVPLMPGGAAVTGPDNTCWGGTASVNDSYYLQQDQDVTAMANTMTVVYAHELMHCFGLPHAHDGTRRTADGYASVLDHTWSSTNTTMSYRINTAGVDHFHRTSIARAHGLDLVERTLRDLEWAYRGLEGQGTQLVPSALMQRLQEAAKAADEALRLYDQGDDVAAAHRATRAREAAAAALQDAGVRTEESVEAWTTSGVNSVGAKNSVFVFRPGVTPTGVQYDYRPITLGDDAERVTVRATWTNTPTSWADLFIGWRAPGVLGASFIDPGQGSSVMSMGTGIHDVADEGPTDGAVTRTFTLDLDHFPALRGDGVAFSAGAGVLGSAVDGAYAVEVVVERRSV